MDITQKIEALGKAKLLGTFANGSPEWHAARDGIGGSDIGVIHGKSQFKSPYGLWVEKTGQLPPVESTIPMRLGTALEPAIRQFFIDENKAWLTVHETGTWQSLEHAWAKANPDGIIEWADGTLGVLEIKHSATYVDSIPESWKLQVLWYLYTLGLERGVVCAVIGGRYAEFEVSVGDLSFDDLFGPVRAFWGFIATGIAPEYDGSKNTYEVVRELSDGLADIEVELGDLWIDLAAAKAIYDLAEEKFTQKKSIVLAFMDGRRTGLYDGETVVKLQARNGKPFITFK
jgi:putative phage-type endonuclease